MKIVNLTQHKAVDAQTAAGVVDVDFDKKLLNFSELPTAEAIANKAIALAEVAVNHGATHAMIGGAPYLMGTLERALKEKGVTPVYSFTLRESVEVEQPDGSIIKTAVFRHKGFVEA